MGVIFSLSAYDFASGEVPRTHLAERVHREEFRRRQHRDWITIIFLDLVWKLEL